MTVFQIVEPTHLTFRDIISRTFSTLKERALFFLGLVTVVILPDTVLNWWGLKISSEMFSAFLDTAVVGVVVYGVFTNLEEGVFVPPSEALPQVLVWPLVVVGLISALISALSLILVEWLHSLGGGTLAGVLIELIQYGLRLFLFTVCLAVVPACVVEKLGPLAGLQRSLQLTRGRRSRIFFLLVKAHCLLLLPPALLIIALSVFLFGGPALPASGVNPTTSAQYAVYLLSLIIGILTGAFFTIMHAVMYCDLRDIEDGLSA